MSKKLLIHYTLILQQQQQNNHIVSWLYLYGNSAYRPYCRSCLEICVILHSFKWKEEFLLWRQAKKCSPNRLSWLDVVNIDRSHAVRKNVIQIKNPSAGFLSAVVLEDDSSWSCLAIIFRTRKKSIFHLRPKPRCFLFHPEQFGIEPDNPILNFPGKTAVAQSVKRSGYRSLKRGATELTWVRFPVAA